MTVIIEFSNVSAISSARGKFVLEYLSPKIGESAATLLVILGMRNLADVSSMSPSYLAQLHGFGPKKISQIEEVLNENGLFFRSEDVDRQYERDASSELLQTKEILERRADEERERLPQTFLLFDIECGPSIK